MRAKKINGVWHSIRSTSFPEIDNDVKVAPEHHGGRFVELSAGDSGQAYQYWPNAAQDDSRGNSVSNPHPSYTHCQDQVETLDETSTFESNNTDLTDDQFIIQFIGYDIFNNHYVKHFKLFETAEDTTRPHGVDYLESFEEERMYSIGLLPGTWTTYESVLTNDDVDPEFLQGDGYPLLSASMFAKEDENASSTKCSDEIEWNMINITMSQNSTDIEVDAVRAERVADAERPDLERYVSAPFHHSEFKARTAIRTLNAHELVDKVFQKNQPDYGVSAQNEQNRSRRSNCYTEQTFSYSPMGPNPYLTFAGTTCSYSWDSRGPEGSFSATMGGSTTVLSHLAGGVNIDAWGTLEATLSSTLLFPTLV
jgi:hypothetical protein